MTTNTLLNTIKIHETDLPVIEFEGERVLPFKLIDQIHGRKEGTSKNNFKNNRQRFNENEDYFLVSQGQFAPDIWSNFGFSDKAPEGILIAQTGYLMLTKSLNDDLAWEVMRELIRGYFRTAPDEGIITPKEYRMIRSRISNLVSRIAKVTDAMELKTLWQEVTDLSQVIEHPLPDIALLGKDHRQMDLFRLEVD